jgi:periplasmic divalent cation tolerance protein
MTDVRVVLTTAGSTEEARRIAYELVERRLAACVNVVTKLDSIYLWKGKVQEAEEYLLVIKTTKDLFPRVRDAIKEMHSYEVPEVISLAVEDGTEEYFKWIDDSVGGSSKNLESP